jgi:predicted exporter
VSKEAAHGMLLRLSQFLFCFLVLGSLVLAAKVIGHVQIDTSLADLSPASISHSASTARQQLSQNIQNRIMLLVSGSDQDAVIDASEELRESLIGLRNDQNTWLNAIDFQVIDDNETVAQDLIEELKPYRFKLLTEQQRNALKSNSIAQIVASAESRLYGLAGDGQLYSFTEDPLAWHSDFLVQLFESIEAQTASTIDNSAHSVISLTANQAQMNLRQQEQLLEVLDTTTKNITDNYDVSIDRSGVFFFAIDAASKSKQDIGLITAGSGVGVILLLLIAFRSIRSFVLPLVSIALGVGIAFLTLHLVYGKVHVLTIVFGASLIGIVVDYSLHYFYHQASGKNSRTDSRVLHRALLLSLLTSLIGYSALGFSSLEALQKVALFSCVGLVVAWLSVISVGELLARKPLNIDNYYLPRLERFCSRAIAQLNTRIWLALALLLIGAALWASLKLAIFSDDPRLFYTASKQLVASEGAVAKVANDFEPGRYLSVSGTNIEEVYARTERLFQAVDADPKLKREDLVSIVDWVPSPAKQTQDYAALGRLYANPEDDSLSQFYSDVANPGALVTLRKQFSNAGNRILAPAAILEILGQSAPPIWFETKDQITSFILVRKGVDQPALQDVARTSDIIYVNTLADTTLSLRQQRTDASKLLLLAYLLVAGLIFLRYRSLYAGSMLLVPLASSAAVVIICFLLGIWLNLFHVMALFLVLGFGMDYTIFVREFDEQRAITLQAILLSAMTSLLSFGLLALSSIPVAQAFGSTLLIGNCFNLIGVFVYSLVHSPSSIHQHQDKGYDHAK